MAGGTAADIRTPWPKGDKGWFLIEFGPVDIPDSAKSADELFDSFVTPFAFTAEECRVTALDITDANTTLSINIEDDSDTPQVLVADAGIAPITQGNGSYEKLTVVKNLTINAGAIVTCSYKSAASDTTTGLKVRLWVKPVN